VKIKQIRDLIKAKRYSISKHALTEAFADGFSLRDILEVIEIGEIVEEYRDRHRCLIYAKLDKNPIHVIVDYTAKDWLWIVTVYKPDPAEWVGGKVRKERGEL